MKKTLLAIALLLTTVSISFAQDGQAVTKRVRLDANSIVNDSLGRPLSMEVWMPLLKSGEYTLKPQFKLKEGKPDMDNVTEYRLVTKAAEQKARTAEQQARYAEAAARNKEAQIANYNARMLAAKPPESNFFTTGKAIRPFKIRTMDGKKIEAKDWAGKTVVLNFWFIGCPPCRAEIPDLNKLQAKYADNPNVVFVAIALDRSWDIQEFVKTNPFHYQLVDEGSYYAGLFNINLYPTNVVVDKQGIVRFHSSGGGGTTPFWLDKTIQESEKGAVAAQ